MKKLLISLLLSIAFVAGYGQSLPNAFPTTGGVADAYATCPSAFGSSDNRKIAIVKFNFANTGATTVNLCAHGVTAVRKWDGDSFEPLVAGDIITSIPYILIRSETDAWFELWQWGGSSSSGGTIAPESGTGTATGTVTTDLASNDWDIINNDGHINISGTGDVNIDQGDEELHIGPTSGFIGQASTFTLRTPIATNRLTIEDDGSWNVGSSGNGTSGYPLLSGGGAANPGWGQLNLAGAGVTGTLPVGNGGTGVTTSSGASSVVLRDANQNITVNNVLDGYTTTATAAGTTTLTVSSTPKQFFTGTTTQTVVLPVVSTLTLGHAFSIYNNSTGVVTVQSSGSNTVRAMAARSILHLTCILTSGTDETSWSARYLPGNPMTTEGDIMVGDTPVGGIAAPVRLAAGTANYVLTSGGPGVKPSWQLAGGISGLTAGRIPIATSSTVLGDDAGLTYNTSTRTMVMGLTSAGTNTFQMGLSGTGLSINNSTGELRMSTTTTHFPTFYSNNAERMRIPTTGNLLIGSTTDNAKLFISQAALSSAWLPALRIDPGAHTSMTASTEFPSVDSRGATQTWATGAITTQRFRYDRSYTIAFAGSSTVSDAYGRYIEPTTAGTNATITRNWGIGTNGNLQVQGKGYFGAASVLPTAYLHLAAGTASAATAPLKLTSGTNLSTTEGGAFEFNGSNLFFTYTDAGTRNTVMMINTNQAITGNNTYTGTNAFGNTVSFADPVDGTKILQWDLSTMPTSTTTNISLPANGDNTIMFTGLRGSATLDFPSTAAGTCEVLTITVTGAAVGDEVLLGVPSSIDPEGVFPTARVSATNTVEVKFCNIQTITALDPASGTYKVSVLK